MKKRGMALLAVPALILTIILAASLAGYDASDEAAEAMAGGVTQGMVTAFVPQEAKAGLIFYPGGLVDHAAYAPLMQALKERGILCLLVQMPLDLAVLDMNAADGLQDAYPEIGRWLIGGHSLGGAMAASYAAKHAQDFFGLVLLGAYSTADLSASELKVLSVYGTQDGVLNREEYAKSMKNYPLRFTEVIIDGGNHARFGSYGVQKGDGEAFISGETQTDATVQAIDALLAD